MMRLLRIATGSQLAAVLRISLAWGEKVSCCIIGAIAELERNLIIEKVRAGMQRARLEGRHIGRNPLELDHAGIQRDRSKGQSLRQIAKAHHISADTVHRVLREHTPTNQEHAA